MKKLLLVCLMFPIVVSAQEPAFNAFPVKDGKVYYEKIIEVDSTTDAILLQRVKTWALSVFNSQKDALQTEDKNWIAYRGFINAPFTSPKYLTVSLTNNWQYWFNLRVYVKENKAKIIIDNIQVGGDYSATTIPVETFKKNTEQYLKKGVSKRYNDRYWKEVASSFSSANLKINDLIKNLSTALNTKSVEDF